MLIFYEPSLCITITQYTVDIDSVGHIIGQQGTYGILELKVHK